MLNWSVPAWMECSTDTHDLVSNSQCRSWLPHLPRSDCICFARQSVQQQRETLTRGLHQMEVEIA
ncbi:hypothetical protein HBI56_190630 [Parastagonospora nodorum]|uniref:Uncharacterized protein n=1 Tax=Phaeosphaeria nodorum (strain SN15 / ATCC MYA-4574 / FGSC 10173) TaxID=321614 RepID=A0A7U2FA21_PHANO|nr:hypothetical protein HBH56_143820 [Parastagonospora nodorum]QRD01457.1 hypothetical protein JI435_416700 [Parastagonospora nodorum SN15]KAH3927780.1 hypothetical protein HBH54_149010 [Parastagonospora nodorum]KAH3947841.1 hypothetical protein HBH53_109060 [Parastagonospora nodorum]KAH3962039.1 hypothetical protein HBH51_177660 [Parastagonospora nodorum]